MADADDGARLELNIAELAIKVMGRGPKRVYVPVRMTAS